MTEAAISVERCSVHSHVCSEDECGFREATLNLQRALAAGLEGNTALIKIDQYWKYGGNQDNFI